MNEQVTARYGIDPYLDWVNAEGMPVVEGTTAIDLFAVQTGPWARFGTNGAAVHLKGRGDFCNMFVFDLPPGGSSTPVHHLYEDIYYVLEGHGSTQIELPDGSKRSFEWGPHSMFSIPVNMTYRHFNADGRKRALISTTTNMPLIMNTFHNERFVFDNEFNFTERTGKEELLLGRRGFHPDSPGQSHVGNKFRPRRVEDRAACLRRPRRGVEQHQIYSRGRRSLRAHVGNARRHLQEGAPPRLRHACHLHHRPWLFAALVRRRQGLRPHRLEARRRLPACNGQFHQHFNLSHEPSRYLALGIGNVRYPFTNQKRETMVGEKGKQQRSSLSIKQGGHQVEFQDQDPRIHRLWLEEMKKAAVTPRIDKYAIPA